MVVVVLLGLSWFCSPLGALVLDFNGIRSSAVARKGSQCLSDKDCSPGKFCLERQEEKPSCAACRGFRRRCQRDAMCCPGALCVNDVCTKMDGASSGLERETEDHDGTHTQGTTDHPIQENKPRRKPNIEKSQGSKGEEGESCLRTFDCGPGLCCARHFWTKICKPVLLEGQVCSRRGHKDNTQAPEIFQRCDCGPGLLCRSQVPGNRQRAQLRVCQKL
ncbi:dickkopf-related protein 4 [Otolemur garnettii]|uniref:Dickkopf WNT signaling pathway inhibitor 4 n=1 Tax=Otolemur garnettii TaxID=30611 RepID=H0XES6_OTOGA|nr:dickkopf-related protein 4 [Otolemur garnettii]